MGLDSIEILVKVEQTFGISIPDREAEKIITVGDFHDAVWRHLEGKYSDKCKNRKEVELVINHILADMAGLELDEVMPEKKIHDDLGID